MIRYVLLVGNNAAGFFRSGEMLNDSYIIRYHISL
nr:MAG TPA: hypothetical protein [Caudoviricetes sp.]